MISVVLLYPNGQRHPVLLAGVPRITDHIRLRNGVGATPSFVVTHVLWMEGEGQSSEPSVIVAVRAADDGVPV